MANPVAMTEVWRGDILESVHLGHAVVCDTSGNIVQAWGDPDQVILPRSSCKMVQALPLIESGAVDAFGLRPEHLALACASHQAAAVHTNLVKHWLQALDLNDDALRCGPQMPSDWPAKLSLIQANGSPCRFHNYCSGKHSGFLTVTKHIGAGPDYVDPDHAVQIAVKEAFEDLTGQDSAGFGIDGCSAPNFATTVHGLARAMAFFAGARDDGPIRNQAAARLVQAMVTHPELVSGAEMSDARFMRAMDGKGAAKFGVEGVYIAILPEKGLGVAVKITDGGARGSECAIAAILVHLGALDPDHPAIGDWMRVPQRNWDGLNVGMLQPAAGFPA